MNLASLSLGTLVLIWLSRKALRHPGAHGFYRFFAWEAILGLVVLNYPFWRQRPSTVAQWGSGPLLILSLLLVYQGLALLRRHGGAGQERVDDSFYEFERTTALVERGIYAQIRHPMYASLMALAWGVFLQNPSPLGTVLAVTASGFLFQTAKADERECVLAFGSVYLEYMKRTRMFIPYVF